MPTLTDPSAALKLFQADLLAGRLPLRLRGAIHSDLFFLFDEPNGRRRFIYLTVDNDVITGLAILANVDRIGGKPCFQLGVAVPLSHRGQGRAKKLVQAALDELQHGCGNTHTYYVEAVVGIDNVPSQKVAGSCISSAPHRIKDAVSGVAAFNYVRKFEPKAF